MTIQEAERRTGLDRATIRFYEREGLIAPIRRENGYRDYGEGEVTALLRIKLLRELDLSLEDIRALQTGALALPEALSRQLANLERTAEQVANAQNICRVIRDAGVGYQELDAETYLNRVLPTDRPCAASGDAPRPYCPWRRYLARTLDLALCKLVWMAVLCLVFHVSVAARHWLLNWLDGLVAMLLLLAAEPVLLHAIGTTPGKALFGLRVEAGDSRHLRYGEALGRTAAVLWRGMGWGIPIYSIWRLYRSYRDHGGGEMSWDLDRDVSYELRETGRCRGLVFVGAWAAILALSAALGVAGGFPPHRDGLTVAEFADNYNFLTDYYQMETAYILDGDGAWTEREPGSYVISFGGPDGPPPALEYAADADGTLTQVRMVRNYDQDSFVVGWPGAEMQLLSLAFAAGEGGWLHCWGNLGLLDLIAEAGSFESYTRTHRGLTLDCRVEQKGFQPGSSFLIPQEGEPAFCQICFTVESA